MTEVRATGATGRGGDDPSSESHRLSLADCERAIPLDSPPRRGVIPIGSPSRSRPARSRAPLETEIAALWAEALGLPEVGVTDAFLDLGGDSLLASKLAARVQARFDLG